MPKESINRLAGSLADALPEGLRAMRDDVERNFRAVLQASLARLDLVTREDFEVQAAVLARTRARLDDLEARLAALENTRRPAAAAPGPHDEDDG